MDMIWLKKRSKLYERMTYLYERMIGWTFECKPKNVYFYMLICACNKSVKTPLDASNHFSDKINILFFCSLRLFSQLHSPFFCIQCKLPHVADSRGCMTTVTKRFFKHRTIYCYHIGAALFLKRVCVFFFLIFSIIHLILSLFTQPNRKAKKTKILAGCNNNVTNYIMGVKGAFNVQSQRRTMNSRCGQTNERTRHSI